jgi:hypothetical protein
MYSIAPGKATRSPVKRPRAEKNLPGFWSYPAYFFAQSLTIGIVKSFPLNV